MTAQLYRHMSATDYHNDPCSRPSLSSSTASVLLSQSPRHAWLGHPKLGGRRWTPTKDMDRGSLAHALLLGAGPRIVEIEADDFRTKDAKEARDEAWKRGEIPVLSAKLDEAKETTEKLRAGLKELGIELTGDSEATILFEQQSASGPVKCRSRLDHVILEPRRGIIYDLKSISSAHPDKCARSTYEYDYHLQSHVYTRAVEEHRPDLIGRVDYVLLFCELDEPHCITPARPDGMFRRMAEVRWQRAVDLWGRCLSEERWPMYTDRIINLAPPPWALARELEEAS